jgi:hypothetical protein
MRLGLGLGLSRPAGGGTAWTPASIFGQGVNGLWLSPTDGTLFGSSDGRTAPAVNQTVGLILDRSQGMELIPRNPDPFFSDVANFGTSGTEGAVVLQEGRVTYTNAQSADYVSAVIAINQAITQNQVHRVTLGVENYVSGSIRSCLRTASPVGFVPSNGDNVLYLVSATGSLSNVSGDTSSPLNCDLIKWVIEEVAGYSLMQTTVSSRPTLRQHGSIRTLDFDGTDDTLIQPRLLMTGNTGKRFTCIVGVRDVQNSSGGQICGNYRSNGNIRCWRLEINGTTKKARMRLSPDGTSGTATVSSETPAFDNGVLAIVADGTSQHLYLNGELVTTETVDLYNGNIGFEIGADSAAPSYTGIEIGELLFMQGYAMNADELQTAVQYVARKAGVLL